MLIKLLKLQRVEEQRSDHQAAAAAAAAAAGSFHSPSETDRSAQPRRVRFTESTQQYDYRR